MGSDFHLGPLCDRFEERLAADVVPLFLGDLVNRPREDEAASRSTVERWRAGNQDLVVVPGNHDPEGVDPWEGVQVHERRRLTILAVPVIPILYKIPTWTHEYAEPRIAEMLAPFRGGSYDVIASHGPPFGVCDETVGGRHIGSHALRAFAETVDFRLWLCGHVHEQRGAQGRLADRPVHNAARTLLDLVIARGAEGVRDVRSA